MNNVNLYEFSAPGPVDFDSVAICLHPALDNVAIAKHPLQPGQVLQTDDAAVTLQQFVPDGHKFALHDIAEGEAIRRYGQIIGFATQTIHTGDHIHSHNLSVRDFDRTYEFATEVPSVDYVPASQRRTFMGYLRHDGRVGTRNYIAVIASVNCSAHTVQQIAHHFTDEMLATYPNVDGVIALAHTSGCAMQLGGRDYVLIQRTLAGMARHPNIAAYVIVGLGCEVNQITDLIANYTLNGSDFTPPHFTIQDVGGVRKTIEAGIQAVKDLLPYANQTARSPQPVSELNIALQCGGSDGWSGVTANPLLGMVSDEVVRQGGTVVLGETTEIYGAEHMLTRRAVTAQIGQKLIEKVRWWEQHTQQLGIEIDNNPSPGNKAGGLTTIFEKSLGAVAKGGTTPLTGVYDYAEPVTARGFTFMDSPGYDPVSTTGQVAGGCNLVMFTTGRGSAFGFKPAPSIKIATNSRMYHHMEEDMDYNAGQILEGKDMTTATQELLEMVIDVASGTPSKSEAQGIGEAEFNPWNLGGTL